MMSNSRQTQSETDLTQPDKMEFVATGSYMQTINDSDGFRPAKESTAASEEANDDNFHLSEN